MKKGPNMNLIHFTYEKMSL